MRKIRVYGRLAKFLGRRVFRAEVSTAAEAVRFLLTNFPHLEAHMVDQHYRVTVGECETGVDELHFPVGGQEDIKIAPVIAGAGTVGRIIAGVALIALSFVTFGAGAFAGVGVAGAWGSTLALGIGASLVLGGVAQLLTPVPSYSPVASSFKNTEQDPQKSYSFSGIQQTSRQGVPVPVIYGEVITGSVVISAAIDVDQVAA